MKLRDCLLCSACGCFTFPTWKRVIPGSVKFSDLHKKYGRDSPISPLDPDINPNGNHRTQSTSSWCNDTAIETTALTLPNQRAQAPASPCCVRLCHQCKEEINVSEGGVVCIRKNSYHPRCVRCYKCKRQVDGSILDGHGRMACVDCARKLSDAALKNEQRCQVIVKHSPKDTSVYDKELEVKELDLSEFEKMFLDNHNSLRFKHAVKPLKWSNKLTAQARAWAIHLIAEQEREKKRNSKADVLKIHTSSNDKGFGQTCCIIPAYARPAPSVMADKVCDQWYSSGKDFNAEDNTFVQEAAPFTQMIWRDTSKLGACLMWYGEMAIIVANYYPAGNYEQEFLRNVTNYTSTSPRRAGM